MSVGLVLEACEFDPDEVSGETFVPWDGDRPVDDPFDDAEVFLSGADVPDWIAYLDEWDPPTGVDSWDSVDDYLTWAGAHESD